MKTGVHLLPEFDFLHFSFKHTENQKIKGKVMKYKELDHDQLRFLTDIRQTYQAYLEAK